MSAEVVSLEAAKAAKGARGRRHRPERGRWILKGEVYNVQLPGQPTLVIAFAHQKNFVTQAAIQVERDGVQVTFRGEARMSREDTYRASDGRIIALTRAMRSARLPRALRGQIWHIMPDVKQRRASGRGR